MRRVALLKTNFLIEHAKVIDLSGTLAILKATPNIIHFHVKLTRKNICRGGDKHSKLKRLHTLITAFNVPIPASISFRKVRISCFSNSSEIEMLLSSQRSPNTSISAHSGFSSLTLDNKNQNVYIYYICYITHMKDRNYTLFVCPVLHKVIECNTSLYKLIDSLQLH